MKFSVSWLKEHLETDATAEQIAERLTLSGLEVEEVVDRAKGLETFVVAEVKAAEKHPDADKLRVCEVFDGTATHQVVCGAPNARAGMKGVFAAEGSYIPGLDVTLKKAKIRGVESSGMLLSEREMGLSDEHDGIVDLETDAPAGSQAVAVMGLDDPVIDIAITPNRGDCLGVRGVARDLAATGLGALKPLDASAVKGTYESPIQVQMNLGDAANACPWFVGRHIKGVKNGPSPKWLQDKLLSVGLRPISALVDITNLMNIGFGRPFHAFDAAKLSGDVQVRLAAAGETIQALDEAEYTLDGEMTVIADQAKAHAIAGIMGGEESGCTDATTEVFLECAIFDPIRTAMTGRKLQLLSDSRYRFERGVDQAFLVDAVEIATRMVLDLCGGEPSDLVQAGAEPDWRQTLTFRPARVAQLTGVDVPWDEMIRILYALGFAVDDASGDSCAVTIPSWRSDIEGEADIVEEIIRIHGYHNIPEVPPARGDRLPKPALNADQLRRSRARRALAARGMLEAVTYSFLPSKHADLFGGIDAGLMLSNPISSDLDAMRPSVLPNLMAAAARNADRGYRDAALFEVGPQFNGPKPGDQEMVAGGIRSGRTGHRHWNVPPRAVDVFDAKADAMAALEAAGAPVASLQVFTEAPDYYHPGRSGEFRLGPKNTLARFGELHPAVTKAMGIKGAVVGFEVFLERLPKPKKQGSAKSLLTLSAFQPVERDFAFVLEATVAAGDVIRAAQGADKALISEVRVFDLFEGGELAEQGKKSLAINVVLQPTEATLTDAEIDAVADKVVAAVNKATGGTLRS